jgi:hypothetical protein
MKRLLSGFSVSVSVLLSFVAATGVQADVVTLHDGREVEGKVERRGGGRLLVRGRFGEVLVDERDVAKVEHTATADELYALERRQTNLDDPDALRRLAAWCVGQGLKTEAHGLEVRADELEAAQHRARLEALAERRRAALAEKRAQAGDDAEAIYQVARWAEAQGHTRAEVDALLREALLADPTHEKARLAAELRRLQQDALAARDAALDALTAARAELARAEGQRRAVEARETAVGAREAAVAGKEATIDDRLADAGKARDEAARLRDAADLAARKAAVAEGSARDLERQAQALRDEALALRNAAYGGPIVVSGGGPFVGGNGSCGPQGSQGGLYQPPQGGGLYQPPCPQPAPAPVAATPPGGAFDAGLRARGVR